MEKSVTDWKKLRNALETLLNKDCHFFDKKCLFLPCSAFLHKVYIMNEGTITIETSEARSVLLKLQILSENGQHVRCRTALENMLFSDKRPMDVALRLEAWLLLSRTYQYLGHVKGVMNSLREVNHLLKLLPPHTTETQTLRLKLIETQLAWKQGRVEFAFQRLQELIPEIKRVGSNHLLMEALLTLGGVCYVNGRHETALEHVTSVISSCSNELFLQHHLMNAKRLKGLIHWQAGEYEKALRNFNDCLALADKHRTEDQTCHVLNNKGLIFWEQGNLEKALIYFQESSDIAERLQMKETRAITLNNVGLILMEKGKLENALTYFQKSAEIFKELANKVELARVYRNIGLIQEFKGNNDLSLDFLEISLAMREEIGNPLEIADALNVLGKHHRKMGEFRIAITYYERCLSLWKQSGNYRYMAEVLTNLGEMYLDQGELTIALEHCLKGHDLRKTVGNKLDLSNSLLILGKIYLRMGKTHLALRQFEESLHYARELDIGLISAEVLFHIIMVHLLREDHAAATTHFSQLEELKERAPEDIIQLWYMLAQGLKYKHSPRQKYKFQAQEIFENLSQKTSLPHEILVLALLNSCELLLFEIETFGEISILPEIKEKLEKLISIAKRQHSYWLLVESYLLKAKFSLLEASEREALELLHEAQHIANEKHLEALALTIAKERLWFKKYLELLQEIKAKPTKQSLRERMSVIRFADTFARMLFAPRSQIREEAKPRVFLAVLVTLLDDGLKICAYHSTNESKAFEKQEFSLIAEAIHLDDSKLPENSLIVWRVMESLYCLSYRFRVKPSKNNTDCRYQKRGVPLDYHAFVMGGPLEFLYDNVPAITQQVSILKTIIDSVDDTYYHEIEENFTSSGNLEKERASIEGKAFRSLFSQVTEQVNLILQGHPRG